MKWLIVFHSQSTRAIEIAVTVESDSRIEAEEDAVEYLLLARIPHGEVKSITNL
ncbi:hypothetical protein PLUTO_00430 [Luteibacter phage vB_LflM-Pluto]|uniref:Uncharacterized protein n=1 Tax=Luteibacter phage vB_LflM-Pluto TaxID=2948611 RepID=A0A9E7SM84_9CAUD|nr:hypothetical protein PLUTO_00430 [Luteibacter phage vB_LflM-Pluto]